jgi:hypothetical protein
MTHPCKFLTLLALASAAATVIHAQNFTASPSGDWNTSTNWNPVGVPPNGSTAVVTNGRTAIVSDAVAPAPNIIRIGNNSNGGTLSVTAGSLTGATLQAASAANATGHYNISGGTLTATASTFLSATGDPATVTGTSTSLTISGGTLNWGTSLNLGLTGTTAVNINGSGGTLTGTGMNANAGTTFNFNLGPSGVTAITGTGTATLIAGAALVIDGNLYAGGPASIPLLDFGTILGDFGANVTFNNFGALTPSLDTTGGTLSLVVVPEPSMVALLAGLGGLCVAGLRRARRSQA